MKYILIIILPFLISNKNLTCADFHSGTFELPSVDGSTHRIVRKDNKQTEFVGKTGLVSEFNIKWLNDCKYLLYNRRVIKGKDEAPEFNKDTLINEIISVTDNKCIITSILMGYDQKVESTMTKIK